MCWNWFWVAWALLAIAVVAINEREDGGGIFALLLSIFSSVFSTLLFLICILRPLSVREEIADIRAEQRKLWTLQMPAETRRILLEPVEARKEKIRRSQEVHGKWSWYFDVEPDSLEVDRSVKKLDCGN